MIEKYSIENCIILPLEGEVMGVLVWVRSTSNDAALASIAVYI